VLGLVTAAGVNVSGLPPRIMVAGRCCNAAVWRGALLATGTLIAKGLRLQAEVSYPNPQTALGLTGAARRIGITDTVTREATSQVLVKDAPALLEILGAPETAAAWRSLGA
jgi:hypothetical protein